MAEYLFPGVYVVEINADAHPIEGVATSTDPNTRAALARELAAVVRRHVPDWTDDETDDPGVTLVQLFAFLGEQLLYRSNEIPAASANRLAAVAAIALAQFRATQKPSGALREVLFFRGKMLHASDFTPERDYRRELRRHVRTLHGYGIVKGLEVAVQADGTSGEATLNVSAGLAIGPVGDLIELADGAAIAVPQTGEIAFVAIRAGASGFGACSARGEVIVVDVADATAVAIARLVRVDAVWAIDPAFTPARARH